VEEDRYIAINGHPIYFERLGDGRPLVLLHGGFNTIRSSFEKQIPFFVTRYQVIAPEQVGHGHSPDAPGTLGYRQMAEDTAELLRRLDVHDADIVGWSDGGILALMLARWHPALVRRLVISGANIRAEGMLADLLRWIRATPIDEMIPLLPKAWREAYVRVSPDGPDHWPIVVHKGVCRELEPVYMETQELTHIQARALVVVGDRDAITLEHTLDIFRTLPQAQLCVLPGTTHNTFQESPDVLNAIMAAFLEAP
jgi:pimeloyl-ACP methyl ester carboxylesterase